MNLELNYDTKTINLYKVIAGQDSTLCHLCELDAELMQVDNYDVELVEMNTGQKCEWCPPQDEHNAMVKNKVRNGQTALLLFDLDGTLTPLFKDTLYPHVEAFFESLNKVEYPPHVSIVSNQGGIALRHWMKTEKFGDYKKYPTIKEVENRFNKIKRKILKIYPFPASRLLMYFSAAYQTKGGIWAPSPHSMAPNESVMWSHDWRKPRGGMLKQALNDLQILNLDTLMIGDRIEDKIASSHAQTRFNWACQNNEDVCESFNWADFWKYANEEFTDDDEIPF